MSHGAELVEHLSALLSWWHLCDVTRWNKFYGERATRADELREELRAAFGSRKPAIASERLLELFDGR